MSCIVVAPAQFIAQRAALAGAAKQAGDQAAAKAIGELRRPTQSAWTVNCLVRSDPAVTRRTRRSRSAACAEPSRPWTARLCVSCRRSDGGA